MKAEEEQEANECIICGWWMLFTMVMAVASLCFASGCMKARPWDKWNSEDCFLEPNGSHKTSTLYHKMLRAQLFTTM